MHPDVREAVVQALTDILAMYGPGALIRSPIAKHLFNLIGPSRWIQTVKGVTHVN